MMVLLACVRRHLEALCEVWVLLVLVAVLCVLFYIRCFNQMDFGLLFFVAT